MTNAAITRFYSLFGWATEDVLPYLYIEVYHLALLCQMNGMLCHSRLSTMSSNYLEQLLFRGLLGSVNIGPLLIVGKQKLVLGTRKVHLFRQLKFIRLD